MFASAIDIAVKYWPMFWAGIKTTLLLSITGTVIGLLIGLVVGSVRSVCSKSESRDSGVAKAVKKIVYFITCVYVEFFRGTPMMVQAVFLYYGLKPVFNWDTTVAGICIISINTGAYMAEILRSGLQSVDVGQTEAARSIGMTPAQTMFHVVLPQGVKNAFPAIGNEFVVNIKDSSVLSVIGCMDLMYATTSVSGIYFKSLECYCIAAVFYLIMTYFSSLLMKAISRKLDTNVRELPSSN